MKKRFLSIITALALCLGLLPTVALAAATSVTYYDWNSGKKQLEPKTCTSATVVESGDTTWGDDGNDGWYVVNSNVEIGSRVTVSGDVHLILADGYTLTVTGGIQVQDNDSNINNGSTNALTIYGQSGGTGTLNTQNVGSANAAIGASNGDSCNGGTITINGGTVTVTGGTGGAGIGGAGIGGTITINGGTVTATGGSNGAGIGGGILGSNGGKITISGGTVIAKGGSNGAGIGGGYCQNNYTDYGNGGEITISGGTIEATGGSGGAGIGGGKNGGTNGGNGGTITISGGKVTANGGRNGGAGIGGGNSSDSTGGNGGNGGTITISGGTVTATGGNYSAGIGGGYKGSKTGGNGGTITISGGTVTATGGSSNSAGIGGCAGGNSGTFQTTGNGSAVLFASSIADQSNLSAWSGVIFESDEGKVYGSAVTPTENFTIDSGKTLLIPESVTLNVSSITAENNGIVYVDGTLTGTVSGSGPVYCPLTVTGGTATPTYAYNSKTYGKAGETVTLTGTNIPAGQVLDGWTAAPSGVTVASNRFTMPYKALTVTARYASAMTITAQPADKTITYGQTATLSVTVKKHTNAAGALTYQWYEGSTAISGATGSSYTTPDNLSVGTHSYKCVITYDYSYTVTSNSATVTVNPLAETTPNISIDFENETLTGFVSGRSYTIDGTAVTPADGKVPVADYLGRDISIVMKASDSNHADSAAQTLTIPARPGAPTLSIVNGTESVTIFGDYYYNTTGSGLYTDTGWTRGTGATVKVEPNSTIYIYKVATSDNFKSAVQALTAPSRSGITAPTVDYSLETLSTDATMEYKVGSGDWTACTGTMAATAFGWDGSAAVTVQFRTAATGSSYASEAQTVTIPARPAAPTLRIVNGTESVTISGDYYYNTTGSGLYTDAGWKQGTGSTITVNPGNSVYIYTPATSGTFKSAVQTLTAPSRSNQPTVTINYSLETLSTTTAMEYKIGDGTWTACSADMAATAFGWNGSAAVTVQFRTAATGSSYASAVQTVTIPARPAAPALSIVNGTESVTISSYYCYNTTGTDYSNTWTAGDDSAVTVAPDASIYIYKAATDSDFKSEVQTLTAPSRSSITAPTINYTGETLSTDTTMEYKVGSGDWTACTDTMAATAFGWNGSGAVMVQFRTKATADKYASEAQTVTIPARPAAPSLDAVAETVNGKNDGQITGVSTAMEYRQGTTGSWTACTNTVITGLAPGAYQVRVKATGFAFAGAAADVTIDVGAPKTYTLNITSTHTFADAVYGDAQPAAQAITIRSSGNWESTIANVAVDSTDFIIGGFGSTVTAGSSINTWTVQPKAGLGAGAHTATITVTYNNGATATATVRFTVSPRDITVSITQGGGTYGGTITPASADLSGVVDGDSVPVTLTYTGTVNEGTSYNSTAVPTRAGSYSVTASISNSDYNLIGTEGAPITVPFAVNKATVSVPTIAGKTYTGSDLIADVPVSERYNVTANAGGTDVGDYDVTLTLADANNYKWADGTDGAAKNLTFTIAQATNAWDTEPNASVWQAGWVYGGSAPTDYGTPKFGTVEVSYEDADEISYIGLPTNAGTYTISFNVLGNDNYTSLNLQINNVTIRKAAQYAPDAPTVKSKTWNSVTLEEIPGAQYSMDGGMTWQDSPTFTGLKSTTEYSFVARYAETDNYFASPAGDSIEVKTNNVPVSTYPPAVEQPDEGGAVTVWPQSPAQGVTVTITPKADDGYEVDQVIVSDRSGNPVEIKDNGDGTYSFRQPAGKVTIKVVFRDATVVPFVDVPADEYYYNAVQWAVKNGITEGTNAEGTLFSPNAPCTREQIVTFLWRAAGCPEPESLSSFADVSADSYYAKAVAWAVENGITNGTGDGTTFSPDDICSRAQIVTFLWRSQGTPDAGTGNPFLDIAADAYYTDAALWAVENGVTMGTNAAGTAFSPDADCTRAQIVTFLYRWLGDE